MRKDLDSSFSFQCGRLFWVKTRNKLALDFGNGKTLPLDSTVTVPLNAKDWTDFALPFRYTMRVGDIIAATRAGGSPYADSLQFFQWKLDSSGKYSCVPFYNAQLKIDSLNDPSYGHELAERHGRLYGV